MIPFQFLTGTVRNANGDPAPEDVVVELAPAGKYTTTDKEGRFGFYDLPEGDYIISLDEKSLPEHARIVSPSQLSVQARYGKALSEAHFVYEIVLPAPKPLQRVPLGEHEVVVPPADASAAKK